MLQHGRPQKFLQEGEGASSKRSPNMEKKVPNMEKKGNPMEKRSPQGECLKFIFRGGGGERLLLPPSLRAPMTMQCIGYIVIKYRTFRYD